MSQIAADAPGRSSSSDEQRTMAVACGAHALHDGYTDLLYVLLPLWQMEFGLGYAEVGVLRALYAGSMAGFQMPAGALADRLGGPLVLALGTALAGIGYLVAGASAGFALLMVALVIGGLGSSTQHPIAANLVAHAFAGRRSRTALAAYNFAGDLGKMAVPAATAWLVAMMPWRSATSVLGIAGIVAAAAVLLLVRRSRGSGEPAPRAASETPAVQSAGRGFPLLLSIGDHRQRDAHGVSDLSAVSVAHEGRRSADDRHCLDPDLCRRRRRQTGLRLARGAPRGGARGVPDRGADGGGILALLPLPLEAGLAVLPLIGVALNGTSSVLYGTVPELVAPERRQRAFSIFYTGAIGAGALSPVLYGLVSDSVGVPLMMGLIAAVVLVTLPLAWGLRPALRRI